MARDIEEFLKKAAERRRQQKKGGAQRPPAQPRQQAPPPRQQPPQRKPLVITDVEVIDEPYQTETVAEHVKKHISTADVTEHASHLGEEVANRDDKVAERIHEKFDHDVGHLNLKQRASAQDTTTSVTARAQSETATQLLKMLRNPRTVAQSIMIAEILKRPEL